MAAALLFSFLDRASAGIGLNTDVPKEVTTIMQGVIILTIVIAYELVRRMTRPPPAPGAARTCLRS